MLSSVLCSIVIRGCLSLYYYCFDFLEEEIEISLDLLEFDKVGLLLKKAELSIFNVL